MQENDYKVFFKYLIPWKVIALIGILFLSFITIYILINFPKFIENDVLRESVIIGITTSIIGSSIYTFLLWLLKPSFIISNQIAVSSDPNHIRNTNKIFVFKVINNSWFFDVQDVNVKLYSVKEYPNDENGEKYNTKRHEVPLVRDKLNIIPSRTSDSWFTNRNAAYAQLFGTEEDLHKILGDQKSLEFQIYAKHSLSGFATISVKKYKLSRCVRKGMFAHGDKFDIL